MRKVRYKESVSFAANVNHERGLRCKRRHRVPDDISNIEKLKFKLWLEKGVCANDIAQIFQGLIAHNFIIGACYQVVKGKSLKNVTKENYVIQIPKAKDYDPENGYTFKYLGKEGIHHTFIEICGGWKRTYTDAQLVGKKLIEVSEEAVRTLTVLSTL